MAIDDVCLSIRNLGKVYNVPVLKGINLDIARGEIHGLVGENGAGKSTLINILAGLVERNGGDIRVYGRDYQPTTANDAFGAGVSFAAQELCVIENLSVTENISLRSLPTRHGVIDRRASESLAREMLKKVGLQDITPESPAGELSLGARQLVEIARAITGDCRVLMLDEPTAALTSQQADTLHALIRELAGGGATIIYVSHRLDDVLNIAHRVTVLRDGSVVSTTATAEMTTAELVEQMTGGHVEPDRYSGRQPVTNKSVLSATDIATRHLPNPVSLELRAGEILGVAGLAGAGKSELLSALFGLDAVTSGCVRRYIKSNPVDIAGPLGAVRASMGYVGEDRRTMGIFPGQSVLNNMMLPDLAGSPARAIRRLEEESSGEHLRQRLSIQCDSMEQDIQQLSGGNQQKVLIARWLNCEANVLLLDEPTRGVDVGTKFSIHALFSELATQGKSLIIASSELDELMAVCDRILVLSNRRMAGVFDRSRWSEQEILSAAFSAYSILTDSTAHSSLAQA